ncbi:DUF4145 domain-containing protein [Lactococcus raffinolactis]|uniref:DUF4145 domain-containing protein n=1 Tax=Pseudolactococcus raffinolactis TaxID=1366 RepID=UPI002415B1E0|nr:DUF4145 domain-containing protein [Lactococcus raffinolactis]MDG4961523.1 DUF4145 domain-containing protein [Lactococcus raffinolactis]
MHIKEINLESYKHLIEISDTCPHCGKIMEPHQIYSFFDGASNTAILVFRCTITSCRKFFILEYNTPSIFSELYEPVNYQYNGVMNVDISQNIQLLSPIFSDTFTEASIAESKSLNNISGLAFRKSFEFLVKDFASYQHPDKVEKIRNEKLNNVIDMFYKDMPKIKELLHIIRRVGNDETHYYREFTDIDVKDLKKLIHSFSLYIDMILNIDEFSEKVK